MAVRARIEDRHANGLLGTVHDVLKRELDADLDVGAAGAGPASPAHPEEVAEPETSELTHEDVQRLVEGPESAEPAATAADASPQPLVPVAVVQGPQLRVAEDLVGLSGLLEPLLGLGVVGVPVRVVPERRLPIRLLNGRIVGAARHTQNLVVVPLHRL